MLPVVVSRAKPFHLKLPSVYVRLLQQLPIILKSAALTFNACSI